MFRRSGVIFMISPQPWFKIVISTKALDFFFIEGQRINFIHSEGHECLFHFGLLRDVNPRTLCKRKNINPQKHLRTQKADLIGIFSAEWLLNACQLDKLTLSDSPKSDVVFY